MHDRLLVIRCRRGSPDALGQIYEKYRDYLLILAVALSHDKTMAEDAVHDAFVTFARRLDQFKLTGSLRAYLATCVANRVRDLMRDKQNQTVSLEDDCAISPHLARSDNSIMYNEQLRQLTGALAMLPYEQREVITLRIYGRMRFGTIGKLLGVSVNTVKGRFRYGLNKLRSILDDEVEK